MTISRLLSGTIASTRDSRLPRGDVHRARDVALVPLVRLAHVEEERAAVPEQIVRVGRRDLRDLGLDLCQELSVGSHYFQEYSVGGRCSKDPCSLL